MSARGSLSMAISCQTGCWASEIEGLTWAQVDLDKSLVRLVARETKNDNPRTVYPDEELQEIFEQL